MPPCALIHFSYAFAVIAMFGYTGPCEFSEVIVIVLIGVPAGAAAAGAAVDAPPLVELLDFELLPHADSASAATRPAAATISSHRRRLDGAPLVSRPSICNLLMGYERG